MCLSNYEKLLTNLAVLRAAVRNCPGKKASFDANMPAGEALGALLCDRKEQMKKALDSQYTRNYSAQRRLRNLSEEDRLADFTGFAYDYMVHPPAVQHDERSTRRERLRLQDLLDWKNPGNAPEEGLFQMPMLEGGRRKGKADAVFVEKR